MHAPHSPASAGSPDARFSRRAACRIVGLARSDLERWERAIRRSGGRPWPEALAFADLVALAVLREAMGRLDACAGAFAIGLGRLVEALRARSDVETMDDHVVLLGGDFARLAQVRSEHVRCSVGDFVVVWLRPILAELRDQVFP